MVTKRNCSFCAGEIEPGTGILFVKRDGSQFYFCSGTCRKHQMNLHRVGHRWKWTRAHALKREAAQGSHVPSVPASKPAPPARRSREGRGAQPGPGKDSPPPAAVPEKPAPSPEPSGEASRGPEPDSGESAPAPPSAAKKGGAPRRKATKAPKESPPA